MHRRGEWRLGLHLIQSCGYNKWRDQVQSNNCCKRSSQVKKLAQTSPTKQDLSFQEKGAICPTYLAKKSAGRRHVRVARSCREVHTKMVPISFWWRWHPHLESSQHNKNPHQKTSILTYMICIPHNVAWLFNFALQSKTLQITACHLPYISFYQCCQCNWNN